MAESQSSASRRRNQTSLPGQRFKDLAALRFGKLLVVEFVGREAVGTARRIASIWLCRCDCGGEKRATTSQLVSGNTLSCGCLRKRPKTIHGLSNDWILEYHAWLGAKSRCNNPKNISFKNYGGRGITVCDRWSGVDGFANFIADMGRRPGPGYSVERKNTDGNYTPENCVWATASEQQNNTRANRIITYKGITLTAAQWARRIGIPRTLFHCRLCSGWSVQRIIETPVRKRRRRGESQLALP